MHVPAVDLIMHSQVMLRSFLREDLAGDRPRVVVVALSRLAFFTWLCMQSSWALVGFALA